MIDCNYCKGTSEAQLMSFVTHTGWHSVAAVISTAAILYFSGVEEIKPGVYGGVSTATSLNLTHVVMKHNCWMSENTPTTFERAVDYIVFILTTYILTQMLLEYFEYKSDALTIAKYGGASTVGIGIYNRPEWNRQHQ